HVSGQVDLPADWLYAGEIRRHRVAAGHRAEDGVVSGLERHVQVTADGRRLAKRRDERGGYVVELDRGQTEARQAGNRAGRADELRQPLLRLAVAVATEIDSRQHDLAVTLGDTAADLGEDGGGPTAAGFAAHERHDAEVAREAATVLDLHERPDAIQARLGLDATDGADVPGHRRGGRFASLREHDDVVRQAGE